MARTLRDVVVWQKAHEFVLCVYSLTQCFPKHEMFGLTSQFRRAAVSIAANIAEGFGRRSPAEKARFLNIAGSSLEECRYYVILAHDLGYADTKALDGALDEIGRRLYGYTKAVRHSIGSK